MLQITVYESLIYSALLRFDREVEQEIIYAFVQEASPPSDARRRLVAPGSMSVLRWPLLRCRACRPASWVQEP